MTKSNEKVLRTVGDLYDFLGNYPRDMPVLATWEGQMEEFRTEKFEIDKYGRVGEEVDTLVIDVDKP